MHDVSRRLKEIDEKRKRGDYADALRLCNDLLEQHSDAYEALWERAFVHSAMGKSENAIEDLTQVIAAKPEEPCYYHERAHFLIDLRKYREAVDDLTEVLRLCDLRNSDYYRNTAHFARAYAYVRLGRLKEALTDCSCVQDNFSWWIEHALWTKAGLLAEVRTMRDAQKGRESNS